MATALALALAGCSDDGSDGGSGGGSGGAPAATESPLATISGPAPSGVPAPGASAPTGAPGSVPVDPAAAGAPTAPDNGAGGTASPDPALFLDAGLADVESLAIAMRQRVLDATAQALVAVNEAVLAGEVDEERAACLRGEYPHLSWFCGDDGGPALVVSTDTFDVRAFEHLPQPACEQSLAGSDDGSGRACTATFAEVDLPDGTIARYRLRLLDGRLDERLALADDPDDLEVAVEREDSGTATCRIRFDLDAGEAPDVDDPAVCERRLEAGLGL